MKRKLFNLVFVFLLVLIGLELTACKTNVAESSECLKIIYYDGGYGSLWLEEFVVDFLAEKKNVDKSQIVKNKDYKLTPTGDVVFTNKLKSDTNCPDIIMTNGIQNDNITAGLIEDLTDVYNAMVSVDSVDDKVKDKVVDGKIAIKDLIYPEVKAMSSRKLQPGQGENLMWSIPWTVIPLSVAYNETLLFKIDHVDTNGSVLDGAVVNGKWTRAPKTVDEFEVCLKDINSYNEKNNTNYGGLAQSLNDGTLWYESLIYGWWSEAQGLDESNYENEGSFYDFWNMESEEQYKQTGIVEALDIYKRLFTTTDTKTNSGFKNTYNNPTAIEIKTMQRDFASGQSVFCLTGDFFENEYSTFLEQYKDTVNVKFMNVPKIDENYINTTFLNAEACMYIPKKAKNIELAKEFLIYINSEEKLARFTEITGGIRPFYVNSYTSKYNKNANFSDFVKSTFELVYNSDDLIYAYPRNYNINEDGSIDETKEISLIYTFQKIRSLSNDYNYLLCYLREHSAKDAVDDILYKNAKESFKQWHTIYDKYTTR